MKLFLLIIFVGSCGTDKIYLQREPQPSDQSDPPSSDNSEVDGHGGGLSDPRPETPIQPIPFPEPDPEEPPDPEPEFPALNDGDTITYFERDQWITSPYCDALADHVTDYNDGWGWIPEPELCNHYGFYLIEDGCSCKVRS